MPGKGNHIGFGVSADGAAKASSDIDNLRDKFDKLQKQGAKGIGLGIAAGATTFALGAMSQAVSEVTDVIGASINAAREDEVSIQKLGTALRDNVKDWDGNTDAIERTIKKRIDLGFADEDQRAGLATLVASTHDATKALQLEQGAMDIARARGLDLATVTDAVAKAYAGNTKQLKSLVPGLNLGKSSAEALANAFSAVAGAAQDYANTDAGRLEVAQAKVNESMERFGYEILPTVTDALVGASDAVVNLSDVLDTYQHGLSTASDKQLEQVQSANDLIRALGILLPGAQALADTEQAGIDTLNAQNKAYNDNTDAMHAMRVKEQADLEGLSNASDDWRDTWHDDTGQVIRDANKVRSQLAKDAQGIIDGYFDPIEKRADLHDQRMRLLADEETKRTAKTKEESRQASEAIVRDLDDEASTLVDLGAQHKLTKKDVDKFTADAKKNYDSLGKDARGEIQSIIDRLNALAGVKGIHTTFSINRSGTHVGGGGPQEFGGGGVVKGPPGSPQDAIVHAGEVVRTPEQEAALHRGGSGSTSVGGGNTLVFSPVINMGGGAGSPGAGRAMAREMLPVLVKELQRQGFLSNRATGLTG